MDPSALMKLDVNEDLGCDKISVFESRYFGTFTKTKMKHGEGFSKPSLESVCNVTIESESGRILGDTLGCVEITVGSSESDFHRRIEICLMTMSKGEISKFTFSDTKEQLSDLTSDKESYDLDVKSVEADKLDLDSTVNVTLVLNEFSPSTPTWKLSSDEKYSLALSHKLQGTRLFKEGNIEAAFYRYRTSFQYLIFISEISAVCHPGSDVTDNCSDDKLRDFRELKCQCHLNLAACQAKAGNHQDVIDNCSKALVLDLASVKAYYRRAVALIALGNKIEARNDLMKAAKLEPRNKTVASLLQSCC